MKQLGRVKRTIWRLLFVKSLWRPQEDVCMLLGKSSVGDVSTA
jgi:hypothetical protein